ncbi:DUF2127 domain-containing protein [Candidatus Woesearchaeota archaeon]|nr:DUF2127 domain-containing protein [Candidatus Woesearchaeota archaeon]
MNIKKVLHQIFHISIFIKAVDGLIEIIAGLVLLLFNTDFLTPLAERIFKEELIENPSDFLANITLQSTQLSPAAQHFAVVYLLTHGILKIGIVLGVWHKRKETYQFAAAFLAILIIIQTIRIINTHSIILSFLTAIDFLILCLLYREYKLHKHKKK